jgi:hypothetical protein
MKGGFGGNYDKYFGVAVGLINIDGSEVYITGCELVNNTLKGAASEVVYGEASASTTVTVQ